MAMERYSEGLENTFSDAFASFPSTEGKEADFFFSIVVAGRPQGKALKARMVGPHARITATSASAREQATLRETARMKLGDDPPYEGPISVEIWAYRPIPNSFSKARTEEAKRGLIAPATRPDADNYAKLVNDAFNALVFKDDAQIVDLVVHKRYALTARTVITIRAFTGDQ